MGYAICTGPCICCKRIFSYNPHRVPSSSAITGKREAICLECVHQINVKRINNGLPPIVVAADAYEPIDEQEL